MRISEQIFPRPVALICSISKEGKPNVMTASFLMPISFNPKYVAFSVAPSRHTFKNLKEVKQFTLNLCSEQMLKIAKICGTYSGNKDKFNLAKITKQESKQVKPPIVKECPLSLECEIEFMQEFGDHWLVIGKVVNEWVREKDFEPLLHKTGNIFPKMND